jgi:hemerythrin-like domain-containing protein
MGSSRRRFLSASLRTALVLPAISAGAEPTGRPIGDEGVGPPEDLMREHAVLNRILLIYEEGIRRIRQRRDLPPDALRSAAGIIRRFLEDYHEKLEEQYLFPRFERAGKLLDLVRVLRAQHQAGRDITRAVQDLTAPARWREEPARSTVASRLESFIRMYRPHEAREGSVLFPAFRDLVTREEFEKLGETFEAGETKALGERGFERTVEEVAQIERSLGIYELSQFTPKT